MIDLRPALPLVTAFLELFLLCAVGIQPFRQQLTHRCPPLCPYYHPRSGAPSLLSRRGARGGGGGRRREEKIMQPSQKRISATAEPEDFSYMP